MRNAVLNPTQIHLLKMFSYAKSDSDLEEMKSALSQFFAERAERAMDELWKNGKWDNRKNEEILTKNLRMPYDD